MQFEELPNAVRSRYRAELPELSPSFVLRHGDRSDERFVLITRARSFAGFYGMTLDRRGQVLAEVERFAELPGVPGGESAVVEGP